MGEQYSVVRIAKDNNLLGKEDEIAIMVALVNAIPQGSYLNSLFSPKMVAWFCQQVRNDFACDLFGEYETAVKEGTQAATKALDRQVEIERLNKTITELTAKHLEYIKLANETADQLRAEIGRLQDERAEEVSALEETVHDLESEKEILDNEISDLEEAVVKANDDWREKYDRDVTRLKVEVYDLLHRVEN